MEKHSKIETGDGKNNLKQIFTIFQDMSKVCLRGIRLNLCEQTQIIVERVSGILT